MNDRFKFRAWDKKHRIMVYCEEEASREQIHKYEALYDWDEDYGCWEYKCLSGLDSLIRDDDFVVEQCTGLKDKNGKLIYEGDIVREISKKEPEWEEYVITVEWKGCGFNLYRDDEFDFLVIGNIHTENINDM